MAVPVSTVPAVKAALVAGITTQVADAAVLVSYDEAGQSTAADIITVGDVTRATPVMAMVGDGGAGHFFEDYTVAVTVSAFSGDGSSGDDPNRAATDVDVRAWLLVAAVETFVRNALSTSPPLGVAGVYELLLDPSSAHGRAEEAGRYSDIPLSVRVRAVI